MYYLKIVTNDIIVAKYENLVSKMMEFHSTDMKQECIHVYICITLTLP